MRANVHQVLPLADLVCGLTTNVLMEAWMYGRRVACFGDPWYRHVPGINLHKEIPTELHYDYHAEREEQNPAQQRRESYLDWFIHDVQVPLHGAGARMVRRLHGEVVDNPT
jgi:hypothetical protein